MIIDELVSFEVAKLAKEKGFREPCIYWIDTIYKELGDSERYKIPDYEKYPDSIAVPTQSLLQRWLREIHDINVISYRTWAMDNSYNYEILVGVDYDNLEKQMCDPNRSYEQALNDGLLYALNLI